MNIRFHVCIFMLIALAACRQPRSGAIEVLFLGHASEHHHSEKYMPLLASALATEGIHFTYTDDPASLNKENLARFDALMIYANHDSITPEQETALVDFVKSGKGFVPLHCASYCFRNSPAYVDMVGGQFQSHETGTFTATVINKEHPVTKGLKEFSTWDETYVHTQLSNDRTVLMERVDGVHREPWTWVKEYGKGRVFYTAYGHDERTWNNPGFHELVRNGILWAVGDKVRGNWEKYRKELPVLKYHDEANIPNYEKRDPAPKFQEPLSPDSSAKLIQVPPGFDLELFASEPDVINPISMAWDEKGRLWVIETVDYPNSVRDDKGIGDDRIKICEDTDGDGRADKFTVFADNLNIPTSMAFYNGGIIVSQAPHFLYLKDTNGDGKADERTVLIDGWGTFDTHAGPSNLQYGMDNHIWGAVGYSGFKGTVGGTYREFGQGLYRFSPDAKYFEFMTGTSNNTWGMAFTAQNDVFGSTANNTHSVFMGIPQKALQGVEGAQISGSVKIDGHYAMHPITQHVRQVDVFGGFTAAAGHYFYTANSFPEEYQQAAFVCEPTGHLVHIAKIEKQGAGFKEKDGWNLFASADEWVSPVEAKAGPDGAVWVLDWYNFIVQHNPTPTPERGGYAAVNGKGNAYENPLRDKTHGRIWRVVYRDGKKPGKLELSKDKPDGLLKALGNENLFWRLTAQRLLVERQDLGVVRELENLAQTDDPAALHALWAIDGLGATAGSRKVVQGALQHKNPAVRKAAIQILSKYPRSEQEILASGILKDGDANTRLAAIVSLTEAAPSEAIGRELFNMSKEDAVKQDEWLSKAVYAAASRHRKGFIGAFTAANPDFSVQAPAAVNRSSASANDAAWKEMRLPTFIEDAGLEIDGVIWFRRVVDVPASAAGKKATLSLGPIDDSDETFVNGVAVGKTEKAWSKPRVYTIPAGVLKTGRNVIAVRVEDTGGGGGICGKPEDLYLDAGGSKIPLNGPWKYDVEVAKGGGKQLFKEMPLAETFVRTYLNKQEAAASGSVAGATVIHIKVIKNEMKYDLKNFTVKAGTPVEIIFENPDFMQHNLVIVQQGALETVGRSADKLAADPNGAEMQYVPSMPEVLFSTRLVNPQESVSLHFTAPAQAGDYPFVCTFPGHWRIMNGVMKVEP
ncbi:PVC-type heme-binding CxxCH protein [Chitinophaga sp. GCM10012297]|uniref:ThuA domain-containing protein n=1 Tax=Chitinophaga chungangae TaxID=2821488 RepID=A0ABS3YAV2_9BACT|nr:PVC-type heme-binding CxxCH protein [Chitinophaga chungangae]MBO9151803.1 ThuA domain-containing protein [Chitinophaga chungangae]